MLLLYIEQKLKRKKILSNVKYIVCMQDHKDQ